MAASESGAVLLVEDDPADLEIMVRAFRAHAERSVDVAMDAVEAADYLTCCGAYGENAACPTPVLVVLDLGLPRGGGLSVLQKVRDDQRLGHIPVVVFTRSHDEHVRNVCYALGANSFLVKPDDAHEFQTLMERTAAYWLGLNILPKVKAA